MAHFKEEKYSLFNNLKKKSAFFLSLEKSKHSQQTITEINDTNGLTVTSPCTIVNELSSFYTELMTDDVINSTRTVPPYSVRGGLNGAQIYERMVLVLIKSLTPS